MDVRQLHYFLKVADHGSLTAAAAHLGVAQPTLTKSIRLLEAQVGMPLLQRLPRGVQVTPAGARLVRHARTIELLFADAARDLGELRDGSSGEVTIGAGPAWLRRHLPEAVTLALASHKTLRARIVGGFESALLEDLRAGNVDFVVAELPSADGHNDLDITPLVFDRLVVAARKGHPLDGLSCTPAMLLDYAWAMPPANTRARRRLDALFVTRNLPLPDIRVETSSMAFLLGVIGRSDLLTFTVETTLEAPDAANLATLAVSGFEAGREAGLIKRRGAWLSPAAQSVIDALKSICASNPRN